MLYISSRNPVDAFTAHRALHEEAAPDGGIYVPFHLSVFSDEELRMFKTRSFSENVAHILNHFFGLHLNGLDVECAVGKAPVKASDIGQRLTVVEVWQNPDSSGNPIRNRLYNLMTGSGKAPAGWPCVAIEIALLFGIYGVVAFNTGGIDVAVNGDDFSEVTAIAYAKAMGLPVNLTVCACEDSSGMWDLINKGEFSTSTEKPRFLEALLYKIFDSNTTCSYITAREKKTVFRLDEPQRELISQQLFVAVVSENRIGSVRTSIYSTNRYTIATSGAYAFGALQDYRAGAGVSRDTVILSMQRPEQIKE